MNDWAKEVQKMDEGLFALFGESINLAGTPVKAIPETTQDRFGVMAANVNRLTVPLGTKVKKGDACVFRGRKFRVSDVPDHTDDLISFDIQ